MYAQAPELYNELSETYFDEYNNFLVVKTKKIRAPVLLAQLKAENNSNKLKNQISQILYILYQHNEITKKSYNNLIK